MKERGDTQDYQTDYEVIPDWVKEILIDKLNNGVAISSLQGGYVWAEEDDVVDLEDKR